MNRIAQKALGRNSILTIKSFFQIFFSYWLEFVSFVVVILLNIRNVGMLNRYPWQDLIYCDFQSYNKWRWFKDSINQLGIFYGLSNSIDFTRNFGENTYLTSRTPSPLFDVGSIFYSVTSNTQLSLMIKYTAYMVFLFLGLYLLNQLLLKKYNSQTYILKKLHIIIFIVIALHPIFYHEVGPMVLWYLFLTPMWLYLFLQLCEDGKKGRFIVYSALPLYLTLGASDLFLFFYFPIFLILGFFIFEKKQKIVKDMIIVLVYLESIILFSKLNYFLISQNVDSVVHQGASQLGPILKSFLAPLYFYSTFLPYFVGPVTVFINIFLVLICLWLFTIANHREAFIPLTKIFLWINIYLILLLVLVHGISEIRTKLPSDFRYHFASLPIFVILLSMLFFHSSLFKSSHKYIFVTNILIVMLVGTSIFSSQLFSRILPSTSKHIINNSFSHVMMQSLPKCINDSISVSPYAAQSRSYFFLTQPIDNGRNDTLTYLIENGVALRGRTFTQWEYSTNRANYLLNDSEGLGGFNTYTLTSNDLIKAKEYMIKSQSPFMLSTAKLRDKDLNYIGTCATNSDWQKVAVPFKGLFSGNQVGNSTLLSKIYVYEFSFSETSKASLYRSADASFRTMCKADSSIILPENYSNQVGVIANGINVTPTRSVNNLVQIATNAFSCEAGTASIYIFSHSWLNFLNLYLLVFLVLLMIYGILKRLAVKPLLRDL